MNKASKVGVMTSDCSCEGIVVDTIPSRPKAQCGSRASIDSGAK